MLEKQRMMYPLFMNTYPGSPSSFQFPALQWPADVLLPRNPGNPQGFSAGVLRGVQEPLFEPLLNSLKLYGESLQAPNGGESRVFMREKQGQKQDSEAIHNALKININLYLRPSAGRSVNLYPQVTGGASF
jgi:hypothetical protein